jgi:proteasome lid subunit RPN8/RPN11
MTIAISQTQLETIYDRAAQIYPEECCGILLGKIAGLTKIVVEVILTVNVWLESDLVENSLDSIEILKTKNSRYTIDPLDILKAQKHGRELNLEIVGFFHSHPDNPAIPSRCDRELAWEVYSYPIVSVTNGKVSDFQSWVLDSEGTFQPEEIQYKLL